MSTRVTDLLTPFKFEPVFDLDRNEMIVNVREVREEEFEVEWADGYVAILSDNDRLNIR